MCFEEIKIQPFNFQFDLNLMQVSEIQVMIVISHSHDIFSSVKFFLIIRLLKNSWFHKHCNYCITQWLERGPIVHKKVSKLMVNESMARRTGEGNADRCNQAAAT